ncbi:helix-turn-helix domain-containing protein [Streptomyces rishiriensis]|uniref:Transcriptional regulator with XRE-family HTH domain n=1 Tax=Streptomyces rishiriensis TaxID=68264 RepID=A0ABU0P355_STRRH|nr:helix-turn-helix transcriptional regulator [Streptomyces rishiriensis]MDQ0585830.1 transcriptional regulator with XRE-family HTH domain [Streptomyces rishiriensis]
MTPKDLGPAYCPNPECGKPIGRSPGSGRPRNYCSDTCGRAYRKAREKSLTPDALAHQAFAGQVADELARVVTQLLQLAHTRQPLAALSLMRVAEGDLEDLKAALIQQARDDRQKNADIAQCLGLPSEQLTRKYSAEAVRRRKESRPLRTRTRVRLPRQAAPAATSAPQAVSAARLPAHRRTADGGGEVTTSRARAPDRHAHSPAAVLTRALSQLQHLSGKSRRELADDIEVSASYVSRVLSGERCPSWKIARRLTLACGGDPAEIQPLWIAARGQTPAQCQSLPAALRGLHLAAARPRADQIKASTRLTAHAITGMFNGTALPAWEDVEELAHALNAEAQPLRPLWNAARAALAGPLPCTADFATKVTG